MQSHQWLDIPGVTSVGGRPRLPNRPDVAVKTLAMAIQQANSGGVTMTDLVDRVHAETRDDRARLEGLAGWLPLSHVAVWGDDGTLDVYTNLTDLALRYAAWVSGQKVLEEHAQQAKTYASAVVEIARRVEERAPKLSGRRTPHRLESVRARPVPDRSDPLVPEELVTKLRTLLGALGESFLERRQHLRASLAALLAEQHVLLLGPPGTAKSMLARALCEAFEDARYFEYLLSRFTHPDELFGPVSIPGLKEEDYRRLTEGFLPQAHVAFLDEIFKANSAILNSLLTLINERVFHHGRHRDPVPLIGVIGASNELPDPDGGLGALYDRFLVRLPVPPLGGPDAFLSVATGTVKPPSIPADARLSAADLQTLHEAAGQIEVPPEVSDALLVLWERGRLADWEVSDRRWRQAIGMLKVAAAADGRRALNVLDLLLLESVLPPEPDRIPEIREALLEQLGTGGVPEHDLRAQWMLLHMDRVAPLPGQPVADTPKAHTPWKERWAVRKANIKRFLDHHEHAVDRLATDREGIEVLGDSHLWLAELPPQVLARHLEAASDLGRILKVAERYAKQLESPESMARAVLGNLPESGRRVYGHGAVLVVALDDGRIRFGLTLAGEREALPKKDSWKEDGLVRPTESPDDLPVLGLMSDELLNWLDGSVKTDEILRRVPAYTARNAATALGALRRNVKNSAIPVPPPLPDP